MAATSGQTGRRQFLRRAAAASGLALLFQSRLPVSAVPKPAPGDSNSKSSITTYRLSTRGIRTCNACKAHAANRFYKDAQTANTDRPHLGCDCGIVTQPLRKGRWNQYFKNRSIYDLRWR